MRYLILGATEALDEQGQAVPLGGHRLRALLAALALRANSDAAVPVDVLIAEVWADPDALPGDAPAALQALVGRLRRTLGRDAVESLPGGYRLRAASDDIDLHRFERLAQGGELAGERGDPETAARMLREALGLWRGPALADLPDRASAAARPEALRRASVQARIAAELELGHAAQVLPELRELAAARPLDEPLHALHLLALRDTGRPAEALEAYEAVRREIADRLGADPGAELRALHADLLRSEHQQAEQGESGQRESGQSVTAVEGPGAQGTPAVAAEPGLPPVQAQTPAQPQSTDPAGPPPAVPGNLRTRLDSFVGREHDLDTLAGDLAASRLVTLTGPGGSGKTRLAEEVAAATPARDGIWLVGLAPLEHPAAVPGAVLSGLGRRETARLTGIEASRTGGSDHAGDATARLIEHLAHRELLLVLDNCEHVIGAAADLAATLLERCPGLVVLATSREPLGVPGETVRPVEPLPPAPAHQLFAERGAAARPGFTADASVQDRRAVAEICRRLDGLPLAIELAAARLRSLTPRQIADRLDDRFRLLTSGSRTVLPRQQTLRAVVDWSWDLLDEQERTVLRRLSVFAGGCTLSAAEYVCADGLAVTEETVLDILGALVDKSILIADRPASAAHTGVRYRLLETIHEYANERAAEHPEDRSAAEARHTEQILRFVTAAEPRLRSGEQLAWLPRVEADLDNIRAVLSRLLQAGDADTVFAVVDAMGWFWWLRNYRDEGGEWTLRALWLLPQDRADRSSAEELRFRGFQLLLYFLLHEQQGQELIQRAHDQGITREIIEAFRRPGPESARFPGLLWPFAAYLTRGVETVSQLMDVCVANARAFGGAWGLAVSLLFRAHIRVDMPRGIVRAVVDLPEIDALAQSTGDRWLIGQVAALRAEIELIHGHYDEARRGYEGALRHAQALSALTETPFLLVRMAEAWYREGDSEQAEKLAERSLEDAERLNVTDARTFSSFLLMVISLDRGDIAQARALLNETQCFAALGSPPAMFDAVIASKLGQLLLAEGASPPEALGQARDALRRAESARLSEALCAGILHNAAAVALGAGYPVAAVQLADGARAMRGALPASVPETRQDAELRARAGREAAHAAGERGAPTSLREAADLLGALLDGPVRPAGVDGAAAGGRGAARPVRSVSDR
ncbi:AfsR/SARP family transcriptional regulator [Streptomyces sp. N2-109]|uniref:AfsR/SARP family transcriptional regulator n=1 Tax=Streptomyces gossypii TaxID=2883101 RepID=A0ABT2JNV8_9ACTN|nr:BTAD domain-containing putative transcriptional regulator [Streptomyces gossypii]MCT2589562.1 AfsR/SARP family transcriptional regulator [Streptomyces gossypii]